MTLAAGTRLGAYEILLPLGAGGMGEVYRARDTRLDRDVAIKLMTDRLTLDPDASARFEREARAVAALSHPNIVALYDIGCVDGVRFAVLELLDGESLARRIASGELAWGTALEIAAGIADGLSSAHSRGIVHRDLKPDNVFLTRDGLVKIVDFGLAADVLSRSAASDAGVETAPGLVFGTLGYMAPEQVRGEPADERSDIFALGCVLYEMLAGTPPFQAETTAEILAAILRDQPPDVAAAGSRIPPRVGALVGRCLEKSPDARFQSARDLAFALREALSDPRDRIVVARIRTRTARRRVTLFAAAAVVIVLSLLRLAGRAWPSTERGVTIRTLAVLPLENVSGDRQQDGFAETMTEQLTARLASLGDWRVTSAASALHYRETRMPVSRIAAELGVAAVVEGTVARHGSRMTIVVQLVDGRTARSLWSHAYEETLDDVLVVQNEIAGAIAQKTDVGPVPAATARLARAPRKIMPAAYDAYVRGRHAWDKRNESDLRDAIAFFQNSIDADPTYAPAYAGLSDSYAQLGYGSYISPDEAFPRARAAADNALALDQNLAEAHASRGYVLMYYDWDFPEAEAEYRRAIQLNPSLAIAHQWYAYLLTATERPFAAADAEISIAKELDPLSASIYTDRAYISYYSGRDEDALHAVGLALEMNSKLGLGYFWLGRIYTSEGRYADAEEAFHHVGPLRTWTPAMAALGYMYAKAGRTADAKEMLDEFDALTRKGRYASPYAIAAIYAGLGDRARVFKNLDAAYHERSNWLVWLKRDPRWDPVRADPRFERLVTDVGLPR